MKVLFHDIRSAWQSLYHNRRVACTAILALTLGIGATTTLFSVVDAVDFRPLPYHDGDRLVVLHEIAPPTFPGCHECNTSFPTFLDWRAQSTVYDAMAVQRTYVWRWLRGGETSQLTAATVSPGLFPMLGVRPALGRGFLPSDLEPGAQRVVVLSDDLWRHGFGADANVLGRTLTLISYVTGRRQAYTVIGVMPAGFHFFVAEAWMPLVPRATEARDDHSLQVFARLKPGATIAQADAELTTIARRLGVQSPARNRGWRASVVSLRTAITEDFGRIGTGRFVLLALVTCILAIVTANVAGILLAQAVTRQHELAIRAALGASPTQLGRPLLIEGFILAATGGLGGVILAIWGVRITSAGLGLARLGVSASVDARVLAFALAASIGVGLACGLIPNRRAASLDIQSLLRDSGTAAGGRQRLLLRRCLVVAEVACTLALLSSAGILSKELFRLQHQVPGYDPRGLYRLNVRMPRGLDSNIARQRAFALSVVDRIARIPGVRMASASAIAPILLPLRLEGSEQPVPEEARPLEMSIGTNFFRTVRASIVRGRGFTTLDRASTPPVAIVNQAAARSYWHDRDPVGTRVHLADDTLMQEVTIVGVVADTKLVSSRLTTAARPILYRPMDQAPQRQITVFARSTARTSEIHAALQAALREMTTGPIDENDLLAMDEVISHSLAEQRFNQTAFISFAFVSLVFAAIGIHGIVAHTVAQRTHEIGIRMALGANRSDVITLVLRQSLGATLAGLILGTAASLALMRLFRSVFVGVNATDPAMLGAAVLFLSAVALLSSYVPARRAVRIDPVITLRSQ